MVDSRTSNFTILNIVLPVELMAYITSIYVNIHDAEYRIKGFRFKIWGLGYRVQDAGFRIQGLKYKVQEG